jgi:predicted DNA-binding protein with PD1-like motif
MLDQFARRHRLRAACVATCVGSLRRAAIRFADKAEVDVVEGPFEIAAGSIVHTTAEIVVVELRGLRFSRQRDAATAFRELVVRKARRRVAI